MTVPISARDRRTLAIGFGAIVTLAGAPRGVRAARDRLARHAISQATLRERWAFARDAGRVLPSLRDSLSARRTRLAALNVRVITAATPAMAAALLGALVEGIANDANVKVSSLELRADTLARSLTTRIAVRVTAEGDVVGLGAFLHAVERRDEPMIVRDLSVSQTDPAAGADRIEVLHFDMTIDGLALVAGERMR